MEQLMVSQMQKDLRYEGFLLIRSSERRKDVRGNEYVDLTLCDRSGEINSKIWNWDPGKEPPAGGKVIWVRGLVQEYNGRLQLRIEKWREITPEDSVDMRELVPCAPRPPKEMWAEIQQTVDSFESRKLQTVVREMLRGAEEKLMWFPAAKRMHHAERSGLLHHTTDMLKAAEAICVIYPWLHRDLLLAGVIIHDLGKLEELKSDEVGNVSDYTREGQLIGHLVQGVANLRAAAEKTGVTGEVVTLLEHLLISHHGEMEYGSPTPPMFPEAEALRWIDMMDARMNAMKSALDRTPEGAFSEKVYTLDRRVYHPRYTDDAE